MRKINSILHVRSHFNVLLYLQLYICYFWLLQTLICHPFKQSFSCLHSTPWLLNSLGSRSASLYPRKGYMLSTHTYRYLKMILVSITSQQTTWIIGILSSFWLQQKINKEWVTIVGWTHDLITMLFQRIFLPIRSWQGIRFLNSSARHRNWIFVILQCVSHNSKASISPSFLEN